ncbi:MAG: EAL domain-containing protein [Methylobacter sp.]|nr:EAL domain-containing protein [Methylobacter sp.]
MNRPDNDGASAPDEPTQPKVSKPSNDSLQADLAKESASTKDAVIDQEPAVLKHERVTASREDTVLQREDTVTSREDTVQMREDTADAREKSVELREVSVQLREKAAALTEMTLEDHQLAEQLQTAKDQLDHLAYYDRLTDLPNRLLVQDRLSQAIEGAHAQNARLAVMVLDLDRFKHINDSLGHAVGDLLLQSVAHRLIESVRPSDTISRQGGGEFVLLFATIEQAEEAARYAQKILAALALPHRIDRYDLHITVSIGISLYPEDGLDTETLIRSAETALYVAKRTGRNHYQFFEQDMTSRAIQRQAIEASLRRALERQEFVLHYQPKINLHTGTIAGVEALIRWQHPKQGLVMPAQFVPIAEDSGLILPIGRWVMREACLQARAWREAGGLPITMAVNTSTLEFSDKDFIKNIQAILAETGLKPPCLELELTETVLMQNTESSESVLQALTDIGIKLAIDDFGTGYSSLSYLQQFPIHTLKIDQAFVRRMTGSPDDATIVTAVINMAKSLKLGVIAEGVETREHCAFLRDQQCDEGQGYYFSRPTAAEALTPLMNVGTKYGC